MLITKNEGGSVGRKHVWYLFFAFLCGYVGVISLMQAGVARAASVATTQWASSTVNAHDYSRFDDMASDDSGNVYAVGWLRSNTQYDFGNGVTLSAGYTGTNPVLVQYDSQGVAQWARSVETGPNASQFESIDFDSAGNVYTVGYITGTSQYDFGNGVTVSGGYTSSNALLVKYTGFIPPTPEIVYQNLPDYAGPINLEEGEVVTTPFFTIRVKLHSEVGIAKVEFYVDDNLLCTSFTPDENGVYSCIWETAQNNSVITIIAYDTLGNTETLTRAISVSLAPATAELTVLPKTGI